MSKTINFLNFKNLKNIKEKINSFSDNKKQVILIIFLVIGVLMMLISGLSDNDEKKQKKYLSNNYNNYNNFDINLYELDLENRLLDIVEKIEGVGKANIMVTLENSVEYIFAQEKREKIDKISDYQDQATLKTQERNDEERKLLLVDGPNGKRQALVKTQLQPKIKGVVVVCQGGDNPSISQQVTSLITTVLNISSNRVYVTKSIKQ
ncbi:MAG: hypothetical protein J6C55_01315 [Oscillospiraceae bacterium]|nr:hypothetical protein [Oscillospiraceae bacterium]